MKPTERDELLSRIDEKTANIYRLTEKQEAHLSKLNDAMLKHAVQIASNKTSIGRLWWLSGVVIMGGGGIGITKLIGLW